MAGAAQLTALPGELAAPSALEVWLAHVPAGGVPDDLRERLEACVGPAVRARLDRYRRPADRDRGLVGHALLRRLLGLVTGADPATLQLPTHCPSCGSDEHGKPYLPGGPGFNLSHAGGLVAVALAPPPIDVGVDVESRERPVDWSNLRRSVFTDAEWELTAGATDPAGVRTDFWSRKEAAVKATGMGLARGLGSVLVTGAGPDGGWAADADGPDPVIGWDVAAAAGVRSGYSAAVAVRARSGMPPGPPDVRLVELGGIPPAVG